MKTIKDIDVNDHCYYFLLDFNDSNSFYFAHILGLQSLRESHSEQFNKLWTIATQLMPIEVNARNHMYEYFERCFNDFFSDINNVYVLVFEKHFLLAKHGNFVILENSMCHISKEQCKMFISNEIVRYMVEQDFQVFWSNDEYEVKKDGKEFIIDYKNGKNIVGLVHKNQTTIFPASYNTCDFSCYVKYTKIPLSL